MATRSSHAHHRPEFSAPPSSSVYRNIALSFLGLTVVVVIAALWVSSVYARVTVTTKKDTAKLDAVIEVAKSPHQGQLQGRVVEGVFEKIQEFTVKEQAPAAVDTVVQGTVKITNNYSKPQTLVQTTRLLTSDGRLYRIDKTVTIQPKQSVQVTAHSDKPGKVYVLQPGVKLTIPGLWIDLQKWIYAETVSGFSGGEQMTKIVSSDDVAQAQKELQDAVFEQAQKTLRAEASVGDDWKAVFIQKSLDMKSNVTTGQKSDQFLASVKLEVTGVFYPQKDMDALIRQKLKEKLPDGRDVVDYDPSLVVYKIQNSDPKLEKAEISVSAQASSRLTAQSPQISKEQIAGMNIADAKEKLMSIEGIQSVEITVRPAWIGKLPTSKDRIDLVVQ